MIERKQPEKKLIQGQGIAIPPNWGVDGLSKPLVLSEEQQKQMEEQLAARMAEIEARGAMLGQQRHDNVNNPKHYQLLPGVQVIDVRDAAFAQMPEGIPYDLVDCWSRSWEYLTRMWGKNQLEDAKKARWYLDRMIQKMEGEHAGDRDPRAS